MIFKNLERVFFKKFLHYFVRDFHNEEILNFYLSKGTQYLSIK